MTAATAGGAYLAKEGFAMVAGPVWSGRRMILAAQIMVASAAGGAAFLVTVIALRVGEFRTAVEWTLAKLRRKKADAGT